MEWDIKALKSEKIAQVLLVNSSKDRSWTTDIFPKVNTLPEDHTVFL